MFNISRMAVSYLSISAALLLGIGSLAPVHAQPYEVWLSDQANSAGVSAAADTGTHGGFIRIYDKKDIVSGKLANSPLVIDVAEWPNATGANAARLHGMLPSPNHNYMNVNFVGSGHLAIVDGRTRAPVALFRSTGTTTGRQNHMSFWSPDGKYLLVANQFGKLLERVNISWDESGDNIVTAVWDAPATLDLAGGAGRITAQPVADSVNYPIASVSGIVADGQPATTPNGLPKEAAGIRPNNTNICPIAVSNNRHVFVTLGGGGMFVVDYTTTPMAIVAEYDVNVFPAAGCGGIEAGGYVHLNQGTSGPDQSMFSVIRMPLDYPAAPSFNLPNDPPPVARYDDPDNFLVIPGNNRDAHGMTVSKHGRYLHQFDRVRDNVEVFDVAGFPDIVNSFDLKSSGVCGTTLGAPTSNKPTPDLLDIAPEGNRIYVALRGPFPLTVAHAAQGSCPGLGIIQVSEGGKQGELIGVLPTFHANHAADKNISDPHAAAVRRK